ncbi:hypothetical protein GE061_007772 [Apolygus lucorum]|uniref:Uncharacterized protein n=1 Tax=Apolygus lucorum TaxID=248454 RepID=A0A6A4ITR1_APOLU|nr:hypothetical protein GE061_007772 [Apolygus lucorum]
MKILVQVVLGLSCIFGEQVMPQPLMAFGAGAWYSPYNLNHDVGILPGFSNWPNQHPFFVNQPTMQSCYTVCSPILVPTVVHGSPHNVNVKPPSSLKPPALPISPPTISPGKAHIPLESDAVNDDDDDDDDESEGPEVKEGIRIPVEFYD